MAVWYALCVVGGTVVGSKSCEVLDVTVPRRQIQ